MEGVFMTMQANGQLRDRKKQAKQGTKSVAKTQVYSSRSTPRPSTPSIRRVESVRAARSIPMINTMLQLRQQEAPRIDLISEVYKFTPYAPVLQTTLFPGQSRSPVYTITTDLHLQGDGATTRIWTFDRNRRALREVAYIEFSVTRRPIVGMAGAQLPVSDFLIKAKSMKLSKNQAYSFESHAEAYKWTTDKGLFESGTPIWKCVSAAASSGQQDQSLYAIYKPSSSRTSLDRKNSIPSTSFGSPSTPSKSYVGSDSSSIASPSIASSSESDGPTLEIYESVDTKPHLRDVLVLTCILLIIQKDDWRYLAPHHRAGTETQNTPDMVFSRMMKESYPTNWSCATLPPTP